MVRTILVAFVLVAAACGGDDPCEKFGNTVCERSCDCAGDGSCRFANAAGTTITFDSESDCKTLYVTFGCGGDQDPVVDLEACTAAVEAASCVASPEGMALLYPEDPACEDTQ